MADTAQPGGDLEITSRTVETEVRADGEELKVYTRAEYEVVLAPGPRSYISDSTAA